MSSVLAGEGAAVGSRMVVEIVDPSIFHGGSLPFWETARPKYAGLRRAAVTHHSCHSLMASSRGIARNWAFEGERGRKADMLS